MMIRCCYHFEHNWDTQ